ncbi:MAG TPA: hypothetical protein PLV72_04375 [Candidatus Magasanikbacteria bacterium]|nr:hypothetical protein [Candidatus Magasanikbacteria bacterium]
MDSILQQLQRDSLSPEIGVSDLLRKAKVVASKLNLTEFSEWIEKELNGYQGSDDLPSYRIVGAELKAYNPYHGWQPIIFDNVETAKMVSKRGTTSPVGELDGLIKSDSENFSITLTAQAKQQIMRSIGFQTDVNCFVARNSIIGILDAVRNLILDWTLKLEKAGVKGEGLSFTEKDEKNAQQAAITYNINNFAGTIGAVSDNAVVNVHQINNASIDEVKKLLEQIKKYNSEIDLPEPTKQEFANLTTNLDNEVVSSKPEYSRITSLLVSMKNILEGATGNVIGGGILLAIQKIISG